MRAASIKTELRGVNFLQNTHVTHLRLTTPLIVVPRQDTDRLQRFAQTEVVTEHAMQIVAIQKGEPIHALLSKEKEARVFI